MHHPCNPRLKSSSSLPGLCEEPSDGWSWRGTQQQSQRDEPDPRKPHLRQSHRRRDRQSLKVKTKPAKKVKDSKLDFVLQKLQGDGWGPRVDAKEALKDSRCAEGDTK